MKNKNVKTNATYGELKKSGNKPMPWELARGKEYQEYRKKWEDYPKKQIEPDAPLHLDIETTNLCNLKCSMCMRTSLSKKGLLRIGSMEFDFYKHLIDQAAQMNVYSVKFNYLGEPLIHPDVVKQVAYAKEKGIKEVMFNTNAVMLKPDMSKKLLDAGIDSIFFSVDSPYPEKYNDIRKGANFHKVKKNIENFMKIKEEGGYDHVQTRVSLVLMDQTDQELDDYKSMFLDMVGIIGYGEYTDRDKNYGDKPVENFSCAQPFQRMFITWDGFVFPCCFDDKQEMILGNANEEKLIDIWHNDAYKNLREHMRKGTYYKLPLCRKCYIPYAQIG